MLIHATRISGLAACALFATACTSLSANTHGQELGAGGFGKPLGTETVTSEATKAAEEAMDAQWEAWDEGARGQAFAYAMIAESDLRCDRYLTAVSIDRNATRGSLDILGLALGAVGGVASPNSNANWFSAGSTLAQGARRSIEDTVLGGREFGLIYTAVWSGREAARRELEARIEDGGFDDWDWRPILSVMRQYDVKCGLNYGLSRLSQAIASPASTQEPDVTEP